MKQKETKEKGTGFFDNLGWLILYLVLFGICTIPLTISTLAVMDQNTPTKVLNFFQNYGVIIAFILTLIMFIVIIKKKKNDLINEFGKFKDNWKKNLFITIIGFLVMFIINYLLSDVLRPALFESAMSDNQSSISSIIGYNTPVFSLIVYVLLLGILVPIMEEIFCRFNFRKSFKSKVIFIVITSLIFGILHIPNWNLSFELIYDLFTYTFLGVSLAYIYCKTESIWSSIIMHILNNIISLVIMIIPFIK